MASHDLQRLIAHAVASGARTSDLARRFGYTDRGMRKLIASAPVQRFLTLERARQEELADEYRARLVAAGGRATETVERVVGDPEHPGNVPTSRWLLDRVCYPRTDPQVNVHVGAPISPEVQVELLRVLAEAEARRAELAAIVPLEEDPHLLDRDDPRGLPSPAGHRLLGPGGSDPFPAVPAHAEGNGTGQGYGPPRVMPPTKILHLRRVTRSAQPAAPQDAASPKAAPATTPAPAPAPTTPPRASAADGDEDRTGARWYPIPYPEPHRTRHVARCNGAQRPGAGVRFRGHLDT